MPNNPNPPRPDQARDKDSIRRDAISTWITGKINTPIQQVSDHDWLLSFAEPETSWNSGHAKFLFRFTSLNDIEALAKTIQSEVEYWHKIIKARKEPYRKPF